MVTLTKTRKVVTQNFLAPSNNEISQLQDRVKELQQAVLELQNLQLASRAVDTDGTPLHGSACELVGGQFLRLAQTAVAPMIVKVSHGLRRKPQGVIWTLNGNSSNQALIAGDPTNGIDPANSTSISIRLNGSIGDIHTGILF